MPQQPTLRRADPLDVVNLYRLVRTQGFDLFDPSDDAGALRQVLDVIQNGYALVAENKAGRLVAALAFSGQRLPSDDPYCLCVCFAVTPAYQQSMLTADLLDLAVRSAREGGLPVHLPMLPPENALTEAALNAGFIPGDHHLWLPKKNKNGIRARHRKPTGEARPPG